MNIVNLTQHGINVVNPDGSPLVSFPASGQVARCATSTVTAGEVAGIPCYRTTFGEVVGLPAPQEGVAYIVSALVRSAVPHREDVFSPGELVRNSEGQPVGCKGLTRN